MDLANLLISLGLGVLVAVVGYLLQKKDAQQEDQIKDLYLKHQTDADKLAALELLVAGDHYKKTEIDQLFAMMRHTLNEGFARVEKAIQEVKDGK